MPKIVNITVYRGEDILLDCTMNPVPVGGIAGWTIVCYVRQFQDVASTLILQKSGTVTDGPSGKFTVTIPSLDLVKIPDKYYYDIWRTDTNFRAVLDIGRFEIKPVVGI